MSLQHNILCSVRSPIDNTDGKGNFMQKAGIHRLDFFFFVQIEVEFTVKRTLFAYFAILYKMMSYLQNKA